MLVLAKANGAKYFMEGSKLVSAVDTRENERDSLFLMADLHAEEGGTEVRVKVRNLSAGGMMVEGKLGAKRGMRVALELRNIGHITGTIVWVEGTRLGVSFDELIDPKLARTKVGGGDTEAPVYARAALSAPRHDGWNGKLRRI